LGVFGLNILIYGVVVLAVIAFLPEGIWPRVVGLLKRWMPI
jgi:ABC-type branched-subunit amino acid transport system permease subunit